MKIEPTTGNVLVELEPMPVKQGRIHIPERIDKGRIVPVAARVKAGIVPFPSGLKYNNISITEMDLKGCRVLVPCYGGFHVDDTHRIYKSEEIIGILTENAEVNV